MKHTHPEISDPILRKLFANELITLRRSMKQAKADMKSEWVCGIRLGLDTFARRVNYILYNVPVLSEAGTLFNQQDNRISAAD
jgi:hypothetical protein